MRDFNQCSQEEQKEISTLCKYAGLVRDGYAKDIKDRDLLWEEQWKLRKVVKEKILYILDR